jgi:hypothetical protein
LLITWLLACLALTIERLYRLRHLRRGTHPPPTAADFGEVEAAAKFASQLVSAVPVVTS